jgi:hypothetical protein
MKLTLASIYSGTLVAGLLSYYIFGVISPGSTAGKIALVVYLGLALLYFVKTVVLANQVRFMRLWQLMLALNALGFFVMQIGDGASHQDYSYPYFRTILLVNMTLYPYYWMGRKGEISSYSMRFQSWILLVIFSVSFLLERAQFAAEGKYSEQNNTVYGLVYLLPLVALETRTIMRAILIAFFIVTSTLSLKRGALITTLVGVMPLIPLLALATNDRRQRIRPILGMSFAVVLVSAAITLIRGNDSLIARFATIESDGGSGRNIIFSKLFTDWLNSIGTPSALWGRGFMGTFEVLDLAAHNDLLEVLVNFGLLGAAIYVGLWISLLRVIPRSTNREQRAVLTSILLMWFFDSQYQQWYNSLYVVPSVMVLGYTLGIIDGRRRQNCNSSIA